MLYYILPPVIIILATATLIFFLFRKVSQYPGNERLLQNGAEAGIFREKFRSLFSALGQFGLKVLERTMHRFKLLSLKFHNTSNAWFHSIKKKREEVMLAQQQEDESRQEEDPITQPQPQAFQSAAALPEAKPVRPLIREVATESLSRHRRPAEPARSERKDQLEEVLIKRIALDPRDIEAYERLGDYYSDQQNVKDALECYKQVAKLSPAHFKARIKIRRIEKMLK